MYVVEDNYCKAHGITKEEFIRLDEKHGIIHFVSLYPRLFDGKNEAETAETADAYFAGNLVGRNEDMCEARGAHPMFLEAAIEKIKEEALAQAPVTSLGDQLSIGMSVVWLVDNLAGYYSVSHEEAFKMLLKTEFFDILNNYKSSLFEEPDEYNLDACVLELEQGRDEMIKYINLD